MLNVTKELTALARKLGYTGKAPDTVAKAINAITSVAGESGGGCDCKVIVVHAEIESDEMTITDATSDEIWEALENGYAVLLTLPTTEIGGKLTTSLYQGLGALTNGSYNLDVFTLNFTFNAPTDQVGIFEVINIEFQGSSNEHPSAYLN